MLLIDAHLDLSMNALEWNRDLTKPVAEIREQERGMIDKPDRRNGMVSLPELRKGKIGLVVATQIARYASKENILPGWHSPAQAWAQTQGQLAWYKAMESAGEMKQIFSKEELNNHVALWNDDSIKDETKPVGFILSLEGADSLIHLSYLEIAYSYGVRAIGPAHYGQGRYCPGTGESGFFTKEGIDLLKEMESLNIILDVTHLTDEAFLQAFDVYHGPVWASHHNCRSIVDYQRQLSDEQIKLLIQRGSVIGGVLDAWMLKNNWIKGKSNPEKENVKLELLVDHFDHICQLAGNCDHIAIGSDLDGMFGTEQSPYDIDTIADLQKLSSILRERGYSAEDTQKIFHGNWLRFLNHVWN